MQIIFLTGNVLLILDIKCLSECLQELCLKLWQMFFKVVLFSVAIHNESLRSRNY